MELTDELVTPGCPQCAIKHLSAYIAYRLMCGRLEVKSTAPLRAQLLAGLALVNFEEVCSGYKSHFDYALGLLVALETEFIGQDLTLHDRLRKYRIEMIQSAPDFQSALFWQLAAIAGTDGIAAAHLHEAIRELPGHHGISDLSTSENPVEAAQKVIASIREEYFPEDGSTEGE